MANTITNVRTAIGPSKVVQYITIASDGTNETATVIYDSSVVATALRKDDPLKCALVKVECLPGVAATARIKLLWDATTDVLAFSPPPTVHTKACYEKIGGLTNTGGAGITGDILLTTTGLAAGDSITLILTVRPY